MRTPPRQASFDLLSRELLPERRLAAAVIAQAVSDARSGLLPRHQRQRAEAFLFDQAASGLRYWCSVAGLDVDDVRARAQTFGCRVACQTKTQWLTTG